jgi:hypothetical protein
MNGVIVSHSRLSSEKLEAAAFLVELDLVVERIVVASVLRLSVICH